MFSAGACEPDCDGDAIEPSEGDATTESAWRAEMRDVKRAAIVADCREWCE